MSLITADNLYIKLDGVSNRSIGLNIKEEPIIFNPMYPSTSIKTASNFYLTRTKNSLDSYSLDIQFDVDEFEMSKWESIKTWITSGKKRRIEFGWIPNRFYSGIVANIIQITPTEIYKYKQFKLTLEVFPLALYTTEEVWTPLTVNTTSKSITIINNGNFESKPIFKFKLYSPGAMLAFNINANQYLQFADSSAEGTTEGYQYIYIDLQNMIAYNGMGTNMLKYLLYNNDLETTYRVQNDLTAMSLNAGTNTIHQMLEDDFNIIEAYVKYQSCYL
jgi:phage-related protein